MVAVIGILALVFVVAGLLVYRVSRASGGQKAQVAQVGKQQMTLLATLLVSEAPFVLIYSHIRLSIPFRQGPCSDVKRGDAVTVVSGCGQLSPAGAALQGTSLAD